jgi:hypothetical protein
MPALAITSGLPHYKDEKGQPLEGMLYFGLPGQNPITAPKQVYWDKDLTQPAAQPIVVSAGYVMRVGTPSGLFTDGDYSTLVQDRMGRTVLYVKSNLAFDNSSLGDKSVSTIVDLKNIPKGAVSQISTLGYYSAGDGGNGTYYYDSEDTTTPGNDGTVIIANDGGRYKLIYQKFVYLEQFGAIGNSSGVANNGFDNTARIQAAVTWASNTINAPELWAKAGIFRITAPIVCNGPITINGIKAKIRKPNGSNFAGGTWFYFDHSEKGFVFQKNTGYFTDVELKNFGTYRNQPLPSINWAPNNNDYDVWCYGVADVVLRDVTNLNPTYGVYIGGTFSDTSGRLEIYNYRAQPFRTGICIDTAFDVVRIDQVHIWPFWIEDYNLWIYQMKNLDAIYSLRNDNPMISNIFTIFARSGLRIGQNANGGTSKIHLSNADFDRGNIGVWFDSTTIGATMQMSNVTHQGELDTKINGQISGIGLLIEGNSNHVESSNFDTSVNWNNAIRVTGVSNRVLFGNVRITQYDQSALNFPAVEAANNNNILFSMPPTIGVGGGIGGIFSATGLISVDKFRSFTPVVTAQTGSITGYTSTAIYKLVSNTVFLEFDIIITNIGNAAGYLAFSLPIGPTQQNFSGHAREMAINGKSLSCIVQSGQNQALLFNYDNTFCGVTGGRYVGTIQYNIGGI